MDHTVKFWRPQYQKLLIRYLRVKKLSVFLRLDYDIIRMVIGRAYCLGLTHPACRGIIRDVHKALRMLFQFPRIIRRVHAGYIVHIIIRVMDVHHIRLPLLHMVCAVMGHRHIGRQLIPLVMAGPKRPVRISVIVRDWHHIGIT